MMAVSVTVIVILGWQTCSEPPGAGAKASLGYESAGAVIKVLYDYRRTRGDYPRSLQELPAEALFDVQMEPNGNALEYREDNGEFEISFRYVGPGVNTCVYASKTKNWNCTGYY